MNVAPIGIFCLLANVAGTTGFKVIIPMLKFLLVLLIGDAIQFLLFGPFTAAVTKVNLFKMPKKFAKMSMMQLQQLPELSAFQLRWKMKLQNSVSAVKSLISQDRLRCP